MNAVQSAISAIAGFLVFSVVHGHVLD